MRIHRPDHSAHHLAHLALRRALTVSAAVLGIAGAAGLSACERSTAPTLAAVGGTVTTPSSTALTLAPNQITIAVGTQAQLSTNASSTQQPQLQWTSSNNAIATVTGTGLVTGRSPGTATIN